MIISIEELEKRFKALSQSDTDALERIDVMNNLAWELALVDTKRSFQLSREAKRISKKLKYDKGFAYSVRNIGYIHMVYSDLEQSLKISKEALNRFKKLGDEEGEATALDNIALAYWRIGSYDNALNYSFTCLKLNQKIQNRRGEAWAYHNIGTIYFHVADYEQAVANLNRSGSIFKEIRYDSGEMRIFAALGEIHEKTGDFSKALKYYQDCLKLSRKISLYWSVANSLNRIGYAYQHMGKPEKALAHYQESLKLSNKYENKETKAQTLLNLGNYYLELGNHKDSRKYLEKSLQFIQKTEAKPTAYLIHNALSKLYQNNGDFEKALHHYKLFHQLKEEVYSEESSTKLKNLQIRSEVEGAEKESEIHRLRYVELAGMQAQLIQSEKMALLGNLVAGIAHEVNTPIGVINSNMNMSEKVLKKIKEQLKGDDSQRMSTQLDNKIELLIKSSSDVIVAEKKIADLINNLKNFASLDRAKIQRIDIRPGIENTIALLKPQFSERIRIIKKLGSIPAVDCYPQELNQVFMTLLMNAAEAVSGKGSITIETAINDGSITIKLSDTGKGIAENQLDKIFEIGFSEKDKSMRMHVGLSNCYNIIQKHNGEISVQSTLGKGTTFKITLPVNNKS